MGFLLIIKGSDYFNEHRKFQVYSSYIFWIKRKNKYLPVYYSLYP